MIGLPKQVVNDLNDVCLPISKACIIWGGDAKVFSHAKNDQKITSEIENLMKKKQNSL